MDQIAKQKWIAALRSGDYKQGHTLFNPDNNTHCCLGVLCEINNIPKQVSNHIEFVFMQFVFDEDDVNEGEVPEGFCGLTKCQIAEAIARNDGTVKSSPQTFTEIADWIETL